MIPNCPVHGTPMRPSNKGGGFFCSKKVGDAYCTQKVSGAQAVSMGQPSAPTNGGVPAFPSPASSESARYQLAAASMIAASWSLGQIADPAQTVQVAGMYFSQMEKMVKS